MTGNKTKKEMTPQATTSMEWKEEKELVSQLRTLMVERQEMIKPRPWTELETTTRTNINKRSKSMIWRAWRSHSR